MTDVTTGEQDASWAEGLALRPQRRSRRVAMTPAEIDEYLASQRTCRVATAGPGGPHLTALWYVWANGRVWLYSIVGSQRWTDLTRDGRVAVLVDDGHDYFELRGVEIRGRAVPVGEAPRGVDPDAPEVAELVEPERLFAAKYFGGDRMFHDKRHAWLRVDPEKISSWDFRKMSQPSA
ncbi:MAG: pyridoxamine 5'-phosphate oxidase family protein [Frankia sp.]|nr:pyridoxamine 5'-phosphate oxidase family protein [Frankia sp.]